MDSSSTSHQTRALSPYDIAFRKLIDEEAAKGDENTLTDTFASDINAVSSLCVMTNLPIGDLEICLRNHWYIAFQAATNYDWMNSKQDTLVRLILGAQTMGILSRQSSGIMCQTSAGRIWSDLPYLTEDALNVSLQSANLTVHKRRNLASFLARLASVGICNDALAGCALIVFREALESPRQFDNSKADQEGLSVAGFAPILLAWLMFASDRLIALSSQSFNGFNEGTSGLGELAQDAGLTGSGFSPSRWRFWKHRLETLAQLEKDAPFASFASSFDGYQEGQHWKESFRQCLLFMKNSAERHNGILTEAGWLTCTF